MFTEGRLTEVDYYTMWGRELRDRIVIDIDRRHGTPLTIVQHAATMTDERARALKRGRAPLFDEIVCVFDCDEHPFIADAIALAVEHGIQVGYSNPCFELWLVLHDRDIRRHTDRQQAQRVSSEIGITTGRSLTTESTRRLIDDWHLAAARAEALDQMHADNGNPSGSNPSTTVGATIRLLRRP